LVRPNQGIIDPGKAQTVQILLVEKDKNSLLQSYQRLGQSALDHSKDKFLVQSVAVFDPARAVQLKDYDQLTSLWATVGSTPSTSAIANKKLHVRHVVAEGSKDSAPAPETAPTSREPIDNLSSDQLKNELGGLRRKYDELVSFSVNLTAERDMLNNTLEQTKRELNRELSKTVATDNARGRSAPAGASGSTSGSSLLVLLIVAVLTLLTGIKLEQMGMVSNIPVLGALLESGKDEL
jgi:vesicle-associated membrane protein-associated protein A